MMYEGLRAIRQACEVLEVGRRDVESLFYGNAARLIGAVLEAKAGWR